MAHRARYPGRLSRLSFFTKLEVAELPKLLMPGERVLGMISGFSQNGTVLLVVTSSRLLVIDKKLVRLSYEDVRYESINEVRYAQQAILASAKFYIMGRELSFKSWYKKELRVVVQFVQNKMFELRPATKADTKKYSYHNAQQAITGQAVASTPSQVFEQSFQEPMQLPPIKEIPKHITDRVARFQRAARFVGSLNQN